MEEGNAPDFQNPILPSFILLPPFKEVLHKQK